MPKITPTLYEYEAIIVSEILIQVLQLQVEKRYNANISQNFPLPWFEQGSYNILNYVLCRNRYCWKYNKWE